MTLVFIHSLMHFHLRIGSNSLKKVMWGVTVVKQKTTN